MWEIQKNMNNAKDSLVAVLAAFIVLKLIDFNNMGVLYYIIVILFAIFVVLDVLCMVKRKNSQVYV
mgnify:CR=1 FL=1